MGNVALGSLCVVIAWQAWVILIDPFQRTITSVYEVAKTISWSLRNGVVSGYHGMLILSFDNKLQYFGIRLCQTGICTAIWVVCMAFRLVLCILN